MLNLPSVKPWSNFHPIVALLLLAVPVAAVDSGVEGRKLVIVDAGSGGGSKIVFVAKGDALAKGLGSDLEAISAHLEIERGGIGGSFSVPAGAFDSNGVGWRTNTPSLARYLNRSASSGIPTGVRTLVLKTEKKLRMSASTLGDEPLDLPALSGSGASIRTVSSIVNGSDLYRHCTSFPATEVVVRGPNASGRSKLVARRGVAAACPGLVLAPTPVLPPPPSAPHLYFDGSDVGAIAALVARKTDPATVGYFASFKATVDGALGSFGTANDDTRARVAKAAGLLQVLGEIPPGGSGFGSYRDVAVTALLGMMDRTPLDSIDKFLNPPPNLLNVLQDSGRLQSMVESYDFLRGAGVGSDDDLVIRNLIATWADAFVADWNLIGDPFGVFDGHRDNWAIKAGSALVSVALSLPGHPSASAWLATGMAYLNESLHDVVMAPGWYSESPHYVNYSLNNLVSTAWQARNAAGADWFDDLAPLIDTALALRQPDGESAPFEEGVPNVFPYDVLAGAYPTRAPRMLWAWNESSRDPVSYDNQQIHSVTRFVVADTTTTPAAPDSPSTMFLDGDTHAVVLRSSWDADGTQLTSITALDHSDSEAFASRHNMENPLDMVLYAAGAMLLPTASGGPEVTSSANRATYLEPSSKNIPLVDGNAPYLLDPMGVDFGERLDSRDASGFEHRVLDCATIRVDEFAPGVAVERTLALVADTYGVAVDRFDSNTAHDYGATWRGRGDASTRILDPTHLGVDYAWPNSAAASAHLAVDVAGSADLAGFVDTGLYAPAWGVEETLSPLRASNNGTKAHFLAVLRPRLDATSPSTVVRVGSGDVAGFRVTDGTRETVIATNGGATLLADGVSSDALLAVAQRDAGSTTGLAMVRGTFIERDALITTDKASTLSVSVDSGGAVITVSPDVTDKLALTLVDLPGMNGSASHTATFDGAPLTGGAFVQSGSMLEIRIPHGGTVVVVPTA